MTDTLTPASHPTAAPEVATAEPSGLTPHVPLERVIMLVNPSSGGVGQNAAQEAEAILAGYACETTVVALDAGQFDNQVQAALDARPDVLFVLAGDGTAGTIASRAGPDGPLVAPLPGGTMNMLPRALYGTADWKVALKRALEEGAPQCVAGGEVTDGRISQAFYCAAILGSPALWAPAREAVREGELGLAWAYARRALKRAFTGRLRFSLDGKTERRAEALVLISPLISRAMDENTGLEAAAMNPSDALQAFRLAAHAVFDDWRQDPAVTTKAIQNATVRARSRIPAVIDGEPLLLRHEARVKFVRNAFRALAPLPPAPGDSV
ncbi:MAG: diacylglycerol kinase family protein [Brevundimonas sp.]|uniref:diacylglycerol/lipid kinase family protein n=1 Tax=Brevundimonas sp. TaxID=1871086 RepID=UPI0027360635|nr:diacylglycerol kinase family protein [Brevundimonas sp.]MDP3656118.1 diacylglycerol kinase family protein [Brevundimonas sp.]MDZ4108337.1 diacylglycerol kinase family protein [Brevundimonas sp.]